MLISESRFRRILREEALRVLREQADPRAEADAARGQVVGYLAAAKTVVTGQAPAASQIKKVVDAANSNWAKYSDPASPDCARLISLLSGAKGSPLEKFSYALEMISGLPSGGTTGLGSFGSLTAGLGSSAQGEIKKQFEAIASPALQAIMKACTPAATPAVPTAAGGTSVAYTVKKGDTFSALLKKHYGVPLGATVPYDDIARPMGIADADVINPGDTINFPPTVTVGGKTYNYKAK